MTDSLLLGNADCRVRVDSAHGGRIASLRVYGEELLVGAGDDPLAWGSYPLAPWAGRLWAVTYSPHQPQGSADKL